MYRRSEIPTIQRGAMGSLQECLYGTVLLASVLDGAILKLFSEDATIGPDMDVADFTEADFGGYSAVTPLTWNGPANDGNIGLYGFSQGVFMADNTIAESQTIYGYFVTNAGEDTVLIAEKFGSPVNIVEENDALELDLYLQLKFANQVGV